MSGENSSIGGVTWHSSEAEGGPDVGISVTLSPDDRLWCGEISRTLFDDCNGAEHFDNDFGWFIVRYAPGNDTRLIAKCADQHEAQEFIEEIAALVRRTVR